MKHLKTYENQNETYPYEWKSIIQKGNKLHVHVYDLATEMEDEESDLDIRERERIYVKLVRKLLIGKVITFECIDCDIMHTGVCDTVEFSSGNFEEGTDDMFQVQFVHISTEDMDNQHNMDSDEVIVHLDIEPEMFRDVKNYNL